MQSEFRSWKLARSVRLCNKSQCKRKKSPINTQLIQRYAGEKRQEESGSGVWRLSCCNKFPPAMLDKTESTSRGVRAKNKGKSEDEEMEWVRGDIYSCYGCMSSPYRQWKPLCKKVYLWHKAGNSILKVLAGLSKLPDTSWVDLWGWIWHKRRMLLYQQIGQSTYSVQQVLKHTMVQKWGGWFNIPINWTCYSEERWGILSAHVQTPVKLKALWL